MHDYKVDAWIPISNLAEDERCGVITILENDKDRVKIGEKFKLNGIVLEITGYDWFENIAGRTNDVAIRGRIVL